MSVYSWIAVAIVVLGMSRYVAPLLWRYKRPIAGSMLAVGGAAGVASSAVSLLLNAALGGTDGGWNVRDDPEKVLPDFLYVGGAGFVALGLGVLLLSSRRPGHDVDTDCSRRTIGRLDSWS